MKINKYLNLVNVIIIFFIINISNSFFAQENIDVKTLLVNGEYQKIVNILEQKLNDNDSLTFSEYNILGNAYYSLMNYNKAIPYLYQASKLDSNNVRNLIILGNCYDAEGNEYLAKNVFENILELDQQNRIALINLGKILIDLDDYNSASDIYNKLINSDSTNSYFFAQLGICELKKNNLESAKINFEKSVKLHNANPKIILMLAKLFVDANDYEKSKEILKYGLAQNTRNKQLNKMLADVLYKEKSYNEAIIKYLYAISIDDTSANVYQKLGISYYYLSFTDTYAKSEVRELKLNEAIEALKSSASKDQNDPINFLYLGLCYKELSQNELAINYFNETLNKIFPDYLNEVYYNLGSCYDEIGKYPEAIKYYKESLKSNNDKKIIYFYLANVYDRYYSDKTVAAIYYKKFIDESPKADEKLLSYSQDRIKSITKESNFWGK